MPDSLLPILAAVVGTGLVATFFLSKDEWKRPWSGKPVVRPKAKRGTPPPPPQTDPGNTIQITQRQAWAILGLIVVGAAVLMVTFALGGIYWGRMLEREAERTLETQEAHDA